VEALAEMPDSTGEVMEELLRDEDSDVRIMAVMVLASVAHPRVPDWLAHVLQHEEHPNVVLNALDVLADRGTAEQLPHLAGVKQRFRSTSMVLFALDAAQAAMGKRNP
jgi:HEAT repeat protein